MSEVGKRCQGGPRGRQGVSELPEQVPVPLGILSMGKQEDAVLSADCSSLLSHLCHRGSDPARGDNICRKSFPLPFCWPQCVPVPQPGQRSELWVMEKCILKPQPLPSERFGVEKHNLELFPAQLINFKPRGWCSLLSRGGILGLGFN